MSRSVRLLTRLVRRLALYGVATGFLVLVPPLGSQVGTPHPGPAVPKIATIAPSLALPMEMDRRVERWVERYRTDQRSTFERYLAREGLYSDMIRKGLRERGMPEELVYLAAVESGFSPGAESPVAATGMWQFMEPTARACGLRIDQWVDERRDPIRATHAALDYLQALYGRFGSWYLAAAAYNAGPGTVTRALRALGGDPPGEADLFWEIVELLPRDTRAYVPKMLALVLLSEEAGPDNLKVEKAEAVRFERVWVPGSTSLRMVANILDLPVDRLVQLNPHLVGEVTPPGEPFALRVPPGQGFRVVASLGSRRRRVTATD